MGRPSATIYHYRGNETNGRDNKAATTFRLRQAAGRPAAGDDPPQLLFPERAANGHPSGTHRRKTLQSLDLFTGVGVNRRVWASVRDVFSRKLVEKGSWVLKYQLFPRSVALTHELHQLVKCFEAVYENIKSPENKHNSDGVLRLLRPHLEAIDFIVETGKHKGEKIPVPVLFGLNNKIDRAFSADGLSSDGRIVPGSRSRSCCCELSVSEGHFFRPL